MAGGDGLNLVNQGFDIHPKSAQHFGGSESFLVDPNDVGSSSVSHAAEASVCLEPKDED